MYTMVVDAATSHVFVSLYDTGKIAVLDFDGNLVKTISGESGARGLTIVGNHLYVAASGTGAIDDIDTGALTKTRTLATGLGTIYDVAYANGALWTVSNDDPLGTSNLVRIDVSDGSTTPTTNPLGYYGIHLAADPADATMLIDTVSGDPGIIGRIDVSTSQPSLVASQVQSAQVLDLAVEPGGQGIVTAGGANYSYPEIGMSDLKPTSVVYPGEPYPEAVAVTAANGGLLAGGDYDGFASAVWIYHLGDTSATITTDGLDIAEVRSHGLAFSPNGARLFAISGTVLRDKPDVFRVLTLSGDPPPGATVSSTASTLPTTTTTPPVPQHVSLNATGITFDNQRVGTFGAPQEINVTNIGNAPVGVAHVGLGGKHPADFFGVTDCINRGRSRVLQPGEFCRIVVFFSPLRAGKLSAQVVVTDTAGPGNGIVTLSGTGTEGYIIAGAQGEVGTFGDAVYHGDATNIHLSQPMISLATTPNGAGYWLLARDGGIFGYGNARFYGSTGAMKLNKPIVAMTASHDGKGYRLVASDGGIFGYGDAHFYGSTGSIKLNRPIVGMAATIDDHGYWLVASDGGIFGFGDAHYYGSAANAHPASSVIQIAPTPSGHGYWLLTAGGQVYGYGDAHVYGTVVGQRVVGMASTPDGRGYWIATRTGAIYHFGNAPGYGDIRNLGVNDVIGIAASAPALPPALLPFSNTSAPTGRRGYSPIPGGGTPPSAAHALR